MSKAIAILTLLTSLAAAPAVLAADPGVEANATLEGVRESFLFPVAGSVQGANGTLFRSEVTVVNFRNEDQEVLFEFLEQGGAMSTQLLTLEAGSFYSWDDFVATVIGRTERLGALRVRGVYTGTTVTDANALLGGFSRIWTLQPDGPGTSSLALPPVQEGDLSNSDVPAWIIGLRQDPQYRANIGIVNLANIARDFTVDVRVTSGNDPEPFTVTVAANSLEQVRLPEGTFRSIAVRITPELAGAWSAYGAAVDNQSGDGWVVKAQYPTRQP